MKKIVKFLFQAITLIVFGYFLTLGSAKTDKTVKIETTTAIFEKNETSTQLDLSKKFPTSITMDDCPVFYTNEKTVQLFADECFVFYLYMKKNFSESASFCNRIGGTLAMPKSSKMNEFIHHHLHHTHNLGFKDAPVWIGLKYDDKKGDYRWADGTELNYNNFKFDERYKECVAMAPTNGEWQEADCGKEKKYAVCELPIKKRETAEPINSLSSTTIDTINVDTSTVDTTTVDTTSSSDNSTKLVETTNPTNEIASTTMASSTTVKSTSQTMTSSTMTCPSLTCEIDCGMEGLAQNPDTGCLECVCDS